MTLLEYLKQLMGRKEPEPAPASVERSEPDESAAKPETPVEWTAGKSGRLQRRDAGGRAGEAKGHEGIIPHTNPMTPYLL